MRRIALSGLALALTLGSASLVAAQQPQPQQGQQPQAGQAQQRQGRHAMHGQHRARGHRAHGERALFKGIKLTDQQKDQLKQVREKYATQAKQLRASLRPAGQQRPDSAQRAALRNSPQFQQLRSLREQELRDVRAVLTADQQKVFDQNLAEQKQRMEQRRAHREERGERGERGGRRGA